MARKTAAERRQEALYRFQVIAPLLPPQRGRRERSRILSEILKDPPLRPDGRPPPRPLTRRTVLRWLQTYRRARGDPFEALMSKVRSDRGHHRKVPPDLLAEVIALRERAARLSVKEILKRIEHQARNQVARRTVSRAMRQAGYDRRDKRRRIAARTRGRQVTPDWDLESWEADFPNEVWQVDSTPAIWLAAGPLREQPVQLHMVNLIDDHSRLIVGGGFVEKLRVTDLLAFLAPAIARYGCPTILYVDRAKVHRATVLVEGLPRLGGQVILGTAGHAPGHGKIERLHQIAQDTLLEDLRLSPVQSAAEATGQHELWRERYACEDHGEIDETPLSRWQRILGNARIPTEEALLWAFRGETDRTVSELGVIRLNGRKYRAPKSHRRPEPYQALIRFDLLDHSQVWIEDEDGSRHACPLHKKLSHRDRRRKRRRSNHGLSFSSMFNEDGDVAQVEDDDPADLQT